MKKFLSFLVFFLLLLVGAVALVFELYPNSEARKFIEPWCGDVYSLLREKVVSAYSFVKSKVSTESCKETKEAEKTFPPQKSQIKKTLQGAKGSTNKISRAEKPFSKKPLEKANPTLAEAKWYSNRRISLSELKGSIAIVCVWNSSSPESIELLKKAQRISEGFRGKPLVVFASHRGGENARVKNILKKADVVIPCCEGAGHPNEPKSVAAGPVFYMIDKAGKLRYYGRNDKVMTVKLVDLFSE